MYRLRDYQIMAADAAVEAFKKGKNNSLLILPTGAGKSLCIADIASRIDSPLLVFCPTKEILAQNYEKICSYNILDVGLYSASVGQKNIRKITLATIGSVKNHLADFRMFKYCIVDEAHLTNARGGMYNDFFNDRSDRCIIGLTATPFRLYRAWGGGSVLKFLTRTRPRIFDRVIHVTQVNDLLVKGYLAPLEYFDVGQYLSFDLSRVKVNSTGADYDDTSLQMEYDRSGFLSDLENWTLRTLHPKDGSKRNGVLVFTRFVRESQYLVDKLNAMGIKAALVSGETPKRERDEVLSAFKKRDIKVVANAATLVCGFDYPALDTVIIAHPTRSLSRWYQEIGRIIRPYDGKKGWVLDMCGTLRRFGKIEDMRIECPLGSYRWEVNSNGRPLTGVPFN